MKVSEAIEWIDYRMCWGRGQWTEHHPPIIDEPWQAGRMAIEALKATQWIPCNKRLPDEKEGVYLICTDYGYLCSCRWTNDVYGLGATKWSAWGWHRLDVPQYSKVVAWMDLKPWKGADDESVDSN